MMFLEVISDRQQDNSAAGLFFFPVSLVSLLLHVSSAQKDYSWGAFSPLWLSMQNMVCLILENTALPNRTSLLLSKITQKPGQVYIAVN